MIVVVGLLASGCNQIFGIDRTLLAESDVDADSISDEDDNCPDLANVGQLDTDADGRGDACDSCNECTPCPLGPDHDEDGDHIPDGCDSCPTVAKANDANQDNDDLGDACDSDPRMQHRVFFDGFGTLAPHWVTTGAWAVSGDAAVALDGPTPQGYRLTHIGTLIDGAGPWTLVVAFDVPASPANRDSVGANLVSAEGGPQWACTVLWDENGWNVTNGIPTPITLTSRTTMTLGSMRATSTDRLCKVAGNPEKASLAVFELYPMSIELFTSRPTQFSYVEVITE